MFLALWGNINQTRASQLALMPGVDKAIIMFGLVLEEHHSTPFKVLGDIVLVIMNSSYNWKGR